MNDLPIVVVGGGLAGGRAATYLALRCKPRKRVVLVCAEPRPPYHRPLLSKDYFLRGLSADALALYSDAHYAACGVELRLSTKAVALDTAANQVVLSDGETLSYSQLLVCTGGDARTLPINGFDLAGVHVLRTVEHAAAIRRELESCSQAVVVGGGFVGLESAAVLRSIGLEVTVVERLKAPLAEVLGDEVGRRLALMHEKQGVRILTSRQAAAFDGDERVRFVRLSDGENLPADLVVVGVGISPSTDWLHGSGVALRDGVLVDERCQTNVPNVFAAGDVCRWEHPYFGSLRIEHETHAQNQGSYAAACMLGKVRGTSAVPFVWSMQYGSEMRYVGHASRWEEVVFAQAAVGEGWSALYVCDGEVRAALTMDQNDVAGSILEQMQRSLPLSLAAARQLAAG